MFYIDLLSVLLVFRNVWHVVTVVDFFKEERRLWIRVVFHAANNAMQKIWQPSLNNVSFGIDDHHNILI
jgi:hypothetical protein